MNASKGYKIYREAANLPETHRYLLVRLHIEQQRFLNFALEAGILNADGVVCDTLQLNRSLLLAILAEIKLLFENFATANGKYEQLMGQSAIDWADYSEPDIDLLGPICVVTSEQTQPESETLTSKRAKAANRPLGLKKNITQTAKNWRTILVEPKRLVWAAVDKDAFSQLISKLDGLKSFLISLLDSSQLRRLQDSMSAAYLAILQLRNDVGDLKALVKAVTPAAENESNVPSTIPNLESNAFPHALVEQTVVQSKERSYLKQLAEIKIQLTKINDVTSGTSAASEFGNLIEGPLALSNIKLAEWKHMPEDTQRRIRTTYLRRPVWIEWKDTPGHGPMSPDDVQIQWRMGLLTSLLRSAKPDGFRAPPCVGYIKVPDPENGSRYGIVFEEPLIRGLEPKVANLYELLGREPLPSLSARIALCAVLARCIYRFHAVNWLHKALRSDNILFFSSTQSPNLDEPFVSGFELSRPSIMKDWTEKPSYDPSKDIYRHPNAQSGQADMNYRKSYDIYSLGILMVEVALWKRFEDIIPLSDLTKTTPRTLREIKPWLLKMPSDASPLSNRTKAGDCLQQVASACGDSFRNIVRQCIKMDATEQAEYPGEQEAAIALRVQRMTEQNVVRELEQIASFV